MEEKQLKKDLSEFGSPDSGNKEDKSTKKLILMIFLPILAVSILGFKFQVLHTIMLYIVVFLVAMSAISTFRDKNRANNKELLTMLALIPIAVLGLFSKFFSDLVMSYVALFALGLIMLFLIGIDNQKIKLQIAYYTFIGSIIVTVILHYESLIKLLN